MQTLKIRHNIEVAHRLYLTKGKCENIHGHSMWVVAELEGEVDNHGLLAGIDFGDAKRLLRNYLDTTYDHHLLLNETDPWTQEIMRPYRGSQSQVAITEPLPGLQKVPGDPTTENIAMWIGEWCLSTFGNRDIDRVKVEVWETQANSATWEGM